MEDADILIDESGHVRFVYSDLLDSVFADDERMTTRASHVEPHPTKGFGWIADMVPSGGPVLGASGEMNVIDTTRSDAFCYLGQAGIDAQWAKLEPFATRQAALDAERAWLRAHKGL